MECELAASRSEAHINLTINSKPEKLLSTSRWTSSVGFKNALFKTLAECTETNEEIEANQMERKGYKGHYSAVALTGTDEYLKVNGTRNRQADTNQEVDLQTS